MENKTRRNSIILLFATIICTMAYLLTSHLTLRLGFPLDDAWIHQTFARNFATKGEWAFLDGRSAGGSTSPLWTFLLSVGYFLKIPYLLWAFSIGAALLFFMGLYGEKIYSKIAHSNMENQRFPTMGLLLVTEWHLIWASLSGMETLLLSFMLLLCAYLLVQDNIQWLLVGLLAGLLIWVRPDGVLVLGPILLLAIVKRERKSILLRLISIVLGFLLLVIPYLVFNLQVAGEIWPTTFFAKQAEYAILREQSLIGRSLRLYSQLLVGVGLIIFPGIIFSIYRAVSSRDWWKIAYLLWALGYVFVYVIRLPVVYQHARYLIPVMPLFLLMGFIGYNDLRKKLARSGYWLNLVGKFWDITIIAIATLFMVIGANAYSHDVAIIESEMVKASKWIKENTTQDSVIAAHDIGALGYFGGRDIIDLAGLIEPDIIPIINDESLLEDYIRDRNADYLFTFPGWYPELIRLGDVVYNTDSEFSPLAGGENIYVYRIEK